MTTLNTHGLEEEFNIPEVIEPEINNEPDPFETEWDAENDNAKILKDNIERANAILDRVQEEVEGVNFSARLVEVAGQLINSITQGSKTLLDNANYNKYLEIRKNLALLKEREVNIKALKIDKPKTQNLIVTSREDLLRILEGKKAEKPPLEEKNE